MTTSNTTNARNHESVVGRTDFYRVDPTKIKVVDGWNPRSSFDATKLDELKESIKENGVIVPIRVKMNNEGEMTLIDGERRLRATLLAIADGAQIVSIPAIIERKTMNEIDQLCMSFMTNMGEPLTKIEEAHTFRRLMNYGLSVADIAKKLGRSYQMISNRLMLLDASPEILNELENGSVSYSDVINTVKDSDGFESQKDKINEIKEKKSKRKNNGEVKLGKKHFIGLLTEAVEWLSEFNKRESITQVKELIDKINSSLDE